MTNVNFGTPSVPLATTNDAEIRLIDCLGLANIDEIH
jgi:hypothetical protein